MTWGQSETPPAENRRGSLETNDAPTKGHVLALII